MYVNDHFTPSVMVATAIEPLTYCFGATIAVRRDVLEQIGGLQSLADHLGDDYYLGKLVTQAGYRIALVPHAVQTTVTEDTASKLWTHELRWARTILKQRPAGYAGSIVTYALPLAAIFAATASNALAYATLTIAAVLRTWLHYEGAAAFSPRTRPTPWFIPVRDVFGLAVWAASFFGGRVQWKSDAYQVGAGGRMAVGPKEM
jgi:ceramide glucosyltransferase